MINRPFPNPLPLLLALLLIGLSAPAWAQTPVKVDINLDGDFLIIDSQTTLGKPKLRMNPNPAYLELAFPEGLLKRAPRVKRIDKGLISKVETLQKGKTALVRISVLNKPASSLSKSDKGHLYKVSVHNMARRANAAKPAATRPTARRAPTPPASAPSSRPRPTVRPEQPPAQPSSPPVAARPTTPPAPARPTPPANPRKTPITLKLQNTPLRTAITQMAGKAGMAISLDPSLSGVVTKNFQNVPLESALAEVLKPYGNAVSTNFQGQSIIIRRKAPAAPSVAPSAGNPRPVTTSAPPAAASQGLVREYFPFKARTAEKAKKAAELAFPNLKYTVDKRLNILLVEGSAKEVQELEKFLRAQSPK